MANDNDGGYLTGYKRPPRNKQFRKGQSGNREGLGQELEACARSSEEY